MRLFCIHISLLAGMSTAMLSFGQSVVSSSDETKPITGEERVRWVFQSTLGPTSLLGASMGAGINTWKDIPESYGPHWDGFARRTAINVSGSATSNTIEASLGAAWGEDPRYPRAAEGPYKARDWNVIHMTYMARNRDGQLRPAYARFVAIPASNFISNSWRAGDDASVDAALSRTIFGFLGRLSGNAFSEFWPDVRGRVFRKNRSADTDLKNAGVREASFKN
jgi:hypothetical protein